MVESLRLLPVSSAPKSGASQRDGGRRAFLCVYVLFEEPLRSLWSTFSGACRLPFLVGERSLD